MRIALVSREQYLKLISKTRTECRYAIQMTATNFYDSGLDVLYMLKEETTMIAFSDEQELTFAGVMQSFAEAKRK